MSDSRSHHIQLEELKESLLPDFSLEDEKQPEDEYEQKSDDTSFPSAVGIDIGSDDEDVLPSAVSVANELAKNKLLSEEKELRIFILVFKQNLINAEKKAKRLTWATR